MEFRKFNANPKNKKAADCVIRAICTALNEDWKDTYLDMAKYCCNKYYMLNEKNGYKSYLKYRGYEMEKMPRKPDNRRYTVSEFADSLAEPNKKYILSVANHLTLIDNKVLVDTWNCGRKSVGNFWIID